MKRFPKISILKWIEEQERRTPKMANRFLMIATQWEKWDWHSRVVAVEAEFNLGHTRRKFFVVVKDWLKRFLEKKRTKVMCPKCGTETRRYRYMTIPFFCPSDSCGWQGEA